MPTPRAQKVKLESLGISLPEKTLTMEELLGACRRRPRLDLERITGVAQRRVAEGQFARDLAIDAARNALALSRYRAEELGVIVCTSISKHDRPDEFSYEPCTAVAVRRALGAEGALVFDVVNACAGMLTGAYVVQGLLRAGVVRCGLVVSGEHNMPLAWTATRELRHSLDGQLAALTLGDCGAAFILDGAEDERHGFHWLDLVTGAKHDHYCYSKPSRRGRGGILVTKARGLQIKGNQHFPAYLKQALDGSGWTFDDVDHAIPHQVSVRAIRTGKKALGRFLKTELADETFLCCAEKYGNTTTTSHFLALHEFMLRGTIRSEQNLLLISGASGIVISHATLTLDDLPDRYRAHHRVPQPSAVPASRPHARTKEP
jgi:3-oxoacyl-[acyl-carrier-protein] synthase III